MSIIDSEGKTRTGKIGQVLGHLGLQRYETERAYAGILLRSRD